MDHTRKEYLLSTWFRAHICTCSITKHMIVFLDYQRRGATIKKELATMSLALDLPKDHGLRVTIAQYKQRFEDYSDEYLS